ncbi:hypothetical protein [Streptomyces shenzhenensis]|uniref:hypothetical protein n=1 Tax=Streptomyces shenzhenensis TaxID=943815 RepID=UPI0015F08AAE|nr:hypothetical protein [Streptomyces shenzhenensis]
MSLVRAEADWIRLCGVAGLGDRQRALLESVLTACDPDSVLTQHVSGARTAVTAIAQAHSALESRARKGRKKPQPYETPTLQLITTALAALDTLKTHLSAGTLDGAMRELSAIKTGDKAGIRHPGDCDVLATRLAARVADVHAAIKCGFVAAWHGTPALETRELLAREVAALCVVEGRWHAHLTDDVRSALSSRGPLDASQLLRVLLPEKRGFRVAVVVEGVSQLESMAGLMNPAATRNGCRPNPRQQPPVITGLAGATPLARPTDPVRVHSLGRIWGV